MSLPGPPLAYSAFFARGPDPFCAMSFDGRFLELNEAWEQALEIPIRELLETPVLDLVHPDDKPRMLAVMRELEARSEATSASAGAEERFESRLRRKTGAYVKLAWSAVPVPEEKVIFASVREAAGARADLRRFKALADTIPYFVGLADTGRKITYVNPAGRMLLGVSSSELREVTTYQFDTPRVAEQLNEEIRPALARDGVWSGESEMRRKDGGVVPVQRLIVSLDNKPGRPDTLATIARDLTEEKRAKRQLQRFKALADATRDLVATVDLRGSVTYMNPAGVEMLGRAGQDVRSLKLHHVVDPALTRAFTDVIVPAVMEKGLWTGEVELLHQGHEAVPVSLVALLLHDERGEPWGFGAIARDLRGQKALEAALEQAVREMSTPMLLVSEGVLALPILGRVDEARAAPMTQALLGRIAETRCRVAVLDLTGASDPDAAMMRALLQMTRAAELLGCRCFLCGASPAAARSMTEADVDAGRVRAFGTLRDALHAAAEITGT